MILIHSESLHSRNNLPCVHNRRLEQAAHALAPRHRKSTREVRSIRLFDRYRAPGGGRGRCSGGCWGGRDQYLRYGRSCGRWEGEEGYGAVSYVFIYFVSLIIKYFDISGTRYRSADTTESSFSGASAEHKYKYQSSPVSAPSAPASPVLHRLAHAVESASAPAFGHADD